LITKINPLSTTEQLQEEEEAFLSSMYRIFKHPVEDYVSISSLLLGLGRVFLEDHEKQLQQGFWFYDRFFLLLLLLLSFPLPFFLSSFL